MRVSWVLPFALVACSASATVDVTSKPAPEDSEPAAPALNPVDAGAAPDAGAKPDADAAPTGPTTVRTCGEPRTTPVPLRKLNVVAPTVPVALGAAVIDGRPSTTERWATGPASALPPIVRGAWGKGGDREESDLLYLLGQEGARDLFADHVEGKTPFQAWASALAPTARRLTYSVGGWLSTVLYSLDAFSRTPTTPATGEWVRTVRPSRTYLFALAVTFASDCALGAMSDLLGARPRVGSPAGHGGTILDASKRAAIQDLLVRDGSEVMLAFAAHKPVAAVDDLMETTTCGTADLSACEAAVKMLDDSSPFPAGLGERPTYEALAEGTDPSWSITSFTTSSVSVLP